MPKWIPKSEWIAQKKKERQRNNQCKLAAQSCIDADMMLKANWINKREYNRMITIAGAVVRTVEQSIEADRVRAIRLGYE